MNLWKLIYEPRTLNVINAKSHDSLYRLQSINRVVIYFYLLHLIIASHILTIHSSEIAFSYFTIEAIADAKGSSSTTFPATSSPQAPIAPKRTTLETKKLKSTSTF